MGQETQLDTTALSEALDILVTELKYPDGRRKKLINYELYCRSCKHYWSQAEYGAFQPICKNGHLTVRILAQYEILEDTYEGLSFDDIHDLMIQ